MSLENTIDPSINETNYEIIYCKDLKLEFRIHKQQGEDSQDESSTKTVWFRILTKKSEDRKPSKPFDSVKYEVFDDSNLYFFYESVFDEQQFKKMKAEDQLLIDFYEFPNNVIDLLDESDNSDSQTQITFEQDTENANSMILEFKQILELKSVEIFRLKFVLSDSEFINRQVQYRYNQMANKLAYKKEFLTVLNQQLQIKNPRLATLIKNPRRK